MLNPVNCRLTRRADGSLELRANPKHLPTVACWPEYASAEVRGEDDNPEGGIFPIQRPAIAKIIFDESVPA